MNFSVSVLFVVLATLLGCASFQHERQGTATVAVYNSDGLVIGSKQEPRSKMSGQGLVTEGGYQGIVLADAQAGLIEAQAGYLGTFGQVQLENTRTQNAWMTAFYGAQGGGKDTDQKVDRMSKALETYLGRKAARLGQSAGTPGAAAPAVPAASSTTPTAPSLAPSAASAPVAPALALPPASEPPAPTSSVANPAADKFEQEVRAANNYNMLYAAFRTAASHDASGQLGSMANMLEGNVVLPNTDQRERFPSDKQKLIENLSGFRSMIR